MKVFSLLEFLRSLCHESKEIAVQQLLLHLPLLHPGNDDARHEYLKLLPKILSHSLEYSIHEEECRQLLSLALVHPAFVPEERNSLTWWLGLLEDKGEKMRAEKRRPPPGFNPNQINAHSPLSGTKSACELWGSQNHHVPVTSTLSYKTPSTTNGWKGQSQLKHTDSGISTSFDGPIFGGYNYKGLLNFIFFPCMKNVYFLPLAAIDTIYVFRKRKFFIHLLFSLALIFIKLLTN